MFFRVHSRGSAPKAEGPAEPEPVAHTPGPPEPTAAAEAGKRLGEMLAPAWAALTPAEALGLVAKYRDGWEL